MARRIAGLCLHLGAAAVLASACNGRGGTRTAAEPQTAAQLGGEVVSTVDGVAIRVADVQALARAGGLSARAALSRLQSEALLAAEAAARGYETRPRVMQVARQAAVQAQLAAEIESVRATDAAIAAAYAAHQDKYHRPELRASTHVLAALPPTPTQTQEQAAHAFVLDACHRLTTNADIEAVLAELKQAKSESFKIQVQDVPASAKDGSLVAPYSEALFAAAGPGPVPTPVRTSFGWHAIVVRSIEPASAVSLQQARAELVQEVEAKLHKAKLDALLVELRAGKSLVYDAKGQAALGALDL